MDENCIWSAGLSYKETVINVSFNQDSLRRLADDCVIR